MDVSPILRETNIYNTLGLLAVGPLVIPLYSALQFLILWIGCQLLVVVDAQALAKIERPYILRQANETSSVVYGLSTVVTCRYLWTLVKMPLSGSMPAWLEKGGMVIYSLLATKWSPEIGHLGHFGGMAFWCL
ncbi:hypothetical protein N431DRAFT_76844 [Stipitochalara longipes BDJ]|nr:hypothetical protein N431DRAFT_76844 [Stipitochalara longipes BDJ]